MRTNLTFNLFLLLVLSAVAIFVTSPSYVAFMAEGKPLSTRLFDYLYVNEMPLATAYGIAAAAVLVLLLSLALYVIERFTFRATLRHEVQKRRYARQGYYAGRRERRKLKKQKEKANA